MTNKKFTAEEITDQLIIRGIPETEEDRLRDELDVAKKHK